jgi:hypothetical protein
VNRNCDACGTEYEARTRRSKFCAGVECKRARERNRKRLAAGATGATVTTIHPPPPAEDGLGQVAQSTHDALVAVDRLNTPAGWNVMAIARRLDASSGDTGSSAAALSKQHLAALEAATRNAAVEPTRMDELRDRRRRRHA